MKKLNKKNRFNSKVKTKSLIVLLVTAFLLSTLVGTHLIGGVSADISYTEYTGTLDGADWALRIPEPWNGMLVILCRPAAMSLPSPTDVLATSGSYMLNAGFAIAASNYGALNLILEGVDSSYKLTKHIIDNYGVTGKVFVTGLSLGGAVALLLGEKYPDVYSGVLDQYGIKDYVFMCKRSAQWLAMTDEELEAELDAIGSPIPFGFFTSLDTYRLLLSMTVDGAIDLTGGTPDTEPEAYEAMSPAYHAEIQIPVITVHGTADAITLYAQALLYQKAVAKAYRSDLYRLYTVPGGGHGTADITEEAYVHFDELVEWSNELAGAHDWPMWGYDPQRRGYSTSNAPNTNQVLWTSTVGMAGTYPAVVDGKLYVGTWSGVFCCLDAATGVQLWNYSIGGSTGSSSAVADGKVYFGSDDDNVYCLDAVTGAKIWSYKTGDDVASSPAVADGKVYVGSKDSYLYCLRADWGQVEWKFATGGMIELSSPAVADGKVYIGSDDGKVYCVDAASGAQVWSYTTGGEVWSSPAVADGKVYVGSYDDNLYCLDATTGANIWSYTTGDDIGYSSPSIVGGKVYVGSYDDNVYCLNAESGAFIWSFTTGGDVWGSANVADSKVYVGSYDNNVYCLDAATGALIWSYTTGNWVLDSPVIANGVAYVVSADSKVYAFSPWAPIPEGLSLGVMLLLSSIAVIVSLRYYRKRPKWQNW